MIEVEDEQAEARYVAAQIAGLVEEGFSGSEIAIFYRMNAQSRVIEQTLRLHQIAYQVIGGPRFYERAEVKDAIAYLQVLDNTDDAVSLMRIANKPKRGIGDTTISRLISYAEAHGISLFDALDRPSEAGLGTAAVKAVTGLKNLLDSLRSAAQEYEVPELLQEVLARSGTLDAYEAERTIEARGRIENLEAFVDGAHEYVQQSEEPTLSGFLQEISLYSDQDALDGEQSNVTLMTIHNAKGLEFRAVFVVGVEEEIFPSARSIEEQGVEEERRLFYVGLTRAEEKLTLTHASSRLLWGRTTAHLPSRFLDELPDRHVERERLRPSSWRSYGTPAQTRDIAPRSDHPALSTGDSVRHGTLGEGVITRIEPGGVVTVRFAERRQRAEADARLRPAREDRLRGSRDDDRHPPTRGRRASGRDDGVRGRLRQRRARGRGLGARAARRSRRRVRWPRSTRGKPVALAGAYAFDLTIPGGQLPCAGVTWVGVMPTHRRQGILRDFMRRQLEDVHGWGEPIAALWASEAAIYGRFGYGQAAPNAQLKSDRARFALRARRGRRRSGSSTPTRRSSSSGPSTSASAPAAPGCSRATSAGGRSTGSPTRRAGVAARARSSTPRSRSTAGSRATRSTASRTSGRTASPAARCA